MLNFLSRVAAASAHLNKITAAVIAVTLAGVGVYDYLKQRQDEQKRKEARRHPR